MMLKRVMSGLVGCGLLIGVTVFAAEKAEIKLEGVKCVVAGSKDVNPEKSAEYKKGKVYFCCDGCKGKFEKDKAKFATSANKQLVATKQYEQKACPISGADVNPEKTVEVGKVKVAFCCEKCQGKVAAAEGDEQAELVFGEKPFEKAFAAVEPEEEEEK